MFLRLGSAILRAPEGDDNGGGGGAEPFTAEQLTALGTIINGAFKDQMKRNLGPAIGEAIKAQKWDELLAPSVTGLVSKHLENSDQDTDTDGEPKPGKKPGGKRDSALEQQLQKLATDLENERKARVAAEQATAEAERKRLFDGANMEFRSALQPKLRPELLDVAVGHFGRDLKLGEDGTALLRVKRAPYKGAPPQDEDVPLSEALPLLLESEAIKPFLPAPGGGGDQTKRGGVPSPGGGGRAPSIDSKDPADRVAARLAAMGIDFNSEFSG